MAGISSLGLKETQTRDLASVCFRPRADIRPASIRPLPVQRFSAANRATSQIASILARLCVRSARNRNKSAKDRARELQERA